MDSRRLPDNTARPTRSCLPPPSAPSASSTPSGPGIERRIQPIPYLHQSQTSNTGPTRDVRTTNGGAGGTSGGGRWSGQPIREKDGPVGEYAPRNTTPATVADVLSWIATNPSKDFRVPIVPVSSHHMTTSVSKAHVNVGRPSTCAPSTEKVKPALALGPWPNTLRLPSLSHYPVTSAILYCDYTWRNVDAVGQARMCEEFLTDVYLRLGGPTGLYKTNNYKGLGINATELEVVLSNTKRDPGFESTDALRVLLDSKSMQLVRVSPETKSYDLVPPQWNHDSEHIVIVYESVPSHSSSAADTPAVTKPTIIIPASRKDSCNWTLVELAHILDKFTFSISPPKKELAALTAVELKERCSAESVVIAGRATKEIMWVALERRHMQNLLKTTVAPKSVGLVTSVK